MSKVLLINGSPNEKGCTYTALSEVAATLQKHHIETQIRYLGKKFTFYSIYVIALSSIMTDLLPAFRITNDVLLICIFGGIINGISVCLCLFVGASAGGTDFISIYFSEKKGIDAWNYIFMGNVCSALIGRSTRSSFSSAAPRSFRCCIRGIRSTLC